MAPDRTDLDAARDSSEVDRPGIARDRADLGRDRAVPRHDRPAHGPDRGDLTCVRELLDIEREAV
jgi:hypothetical protein